MAADAFLPYGQQSIDDDDIAAVNETLRGDWLTTGPNVEAFEKAFASNVGSSQAVAVNSGTAALHAAMHALDIGPQDDVIVPAITFVASANVVVYQGGTPVFADVQKDSLLIDPESVERRISARTKAIVSVDYAGQPCDYGALDAIADRHGLSIVSDACHALGGSYRGRAVGTLATASTFSFHPVKHITTGEGGMVTTDRPDLADRMRRFRNHGIETDHRQRSDKGTHAYEMVDLGFNYRLTDFQCALGISQLKHIDAWVSRRREIAARYDELLNGIEGVRPLREAEGVEHAHHLYVVRLGGADVAVDRDQVFAAMRARNIGVNVHYPPVHLHPFYRQRFGFAEGLCPNAEAVYKQVLSLPMFPAMRDSDIERVVGALADAIQTARNAA